MDPRGAPGSATLRRGTDQPGVIRLVLIEDHELVRHGIRALLESQSDLVVVGEAATAAEGVRRVGFDQPDVALLDLDLPDGSGVDVCRRIGSVSPATKVLILTAFADPEALLAARNAGAAGFILKRVGDSDLIEQIRNVNRGGSAFSDTPAGPPAPPSRDPLLKRLTPRETKILELIAEGKTNREIADQLFLAEKTVKNYVSNLLLKMGIRHRAGAAAYLARIRAESEFHYPPSVWQRSRLR